MMQLTLNPSIARLRCSKSGKEVASGGFAKPIGLCHCCPPPGKPIVIEYDREKVTAGWLRNHQPAQGLWRFAPLLPVEMPCPEFARDVGASLCVVNSRLSQETGVEVWLKNEAGNPSCSFKDRGLAMGVAFGRACGAQRFCLPTQGNAGVAACLFSARLGLPGAIVYMPESYVGSIYHNACELFGGEVLFFGANIAAAGRKMREDLADKLTAGELVDMSTFFEPGRLEGKKTMGLEIAEFFTGQPLPDCVIYPTGGGTGLVGIWKAFQELSAFGLADPHHTVLPRMIAVQSENCSPLVTAFNAGADEVTPVTSRGTVADGLDVPGAIMGHAMLRVLRESGGLAVAVTEESIRQAFGDLGRVGVPAGYESAATLAALQDLIATGHIERGARVLLLLTGSHMIPLSRSCSA